MFVLICINIICFLRWCSVHIHFTIRNVSNSFCTFFQNGNINFIILSFSFHSFCKLLLWLLLQNYARSFLCLNLSSLTWHVDSFPNSCEMNCVRSALTRLEGWMVLIDSLLQKLKKKLHHCADDCWHWIFMYSETEVFWGFCILSEVYSLWQGRDGGARAKDSHFWARPLPLHLPSAKNAYKAGAETQCCKYKLFDVIVEGRKLF